MVAGRPFLDAHQALQASARVEVGPDWIGASPWLPSWLAHTSAVRDHGKASLAVVRAGERTLHKDVFTSDDNGVNGSCFHADDSNIIVSWWRAR